MGGWFFPGSTRVGFPFSFPEETQSATSKEAKEPLQCPSLVGVDLSGPSKSCFCWQFKNRYPNLFLDTLEKDTRMLSKKLLR